MTKEQAIAKGYKIVKASAYEVGLIKRRPDGTAQGVRTWFNSSFTAFPDLDHPEVQRAIDIQEQYDQELQDFIKTQTNAADLNENT